MSNDTPEPSPAAPTPVLPVVTTGSGSPAPARRGGVWLGALALLLAVLTLMMAGLLWQKVDFTQKELARRTQVSETQSSETRTVAAQAEAQVKELQARLAVAEVRLSEVSLQRSQLEELMLALSRSRDDNLVQDLESSLRLAQQQSQLTGSVQPLLAALQSADERIARAAQPRLNPVQRAIARDVQRIRSTSVADVPSLVQRLDELVQRVDQWPVPNDVGPRSPAARKASGSGSASTASANPAEPVAPAAGGWDRAVQTWSGFWSRVWEETTRSGRELVRVSRIDRPEAVLLAPEQAFFLRENLKLRLLNARLGLLARQMDAVQDDLKTIDAALARHFDTTAPDVAAAQAAVTQLRAELVLTEWPRPEESLAALAVAAGGR
ncbi:uroporphyrinogen-III C-methyltransferase [Hydrogenophaga pseudoflava]|uniref:Uroporphyrinogen-III C-methyltransferase n=1 Tax=Hydrogenophaga pseudoflava TaxID=47421 RepID=A0A4P6X0T0_HYDPS|nr:uroporphyrinogen-III C-methyltransferase [Hydrogenophaga pseudoflava]QBM29747.1 Putative uroporphyrinogen-III C-methyltransferase [Hydrogenophaga pseudoflava]